MEEVSKEHTKLLKSHWETLIFTNYTITYILYSQLCKYFAIFQIGSFCTACHQIVPLYCAWLGLSGLGSLVCQSAKVTLNEIELNLVLCPISESVIGERGFLDWGSSSLAPHIVSRFFWHVEKLPWCPHNRKYVVVKPLCAYFRVELSIILSLFSRLSLWWNIK